jgi:hypothetical protein
LAKQKGPPAVVRFPRYSILPVLQGVTSEKPRHNGDRHLEDSEPVPVGERKRKEKGKGKKKGTFLNNAATCTVWSIGN